MLLKSQVKYIQSLGQKKFRDEEGAFMAEGPKIIRELLLSNNLSLVDLFATESWISENPALAAGSDGSRWHAVDESSLGRISALSTPNQVLAVFKKPPKAPLELRRRVSLVLDDIQDPGNMGTIIRIADWFGIRYLICGLHCVDVYNPKCIQSSMASIARVQSEYVDLDAFLAAHPKIPVYAATLQGESVLGMKPLTEGLLVIGNESQGIRPSLLARIKHQISIPRLGDAESLNAAVATGIILSHLVSPPRNL